MRRHVLGMRLTRTQVTVDDEIRALIGVNTSVRKLETVDTLLHDMFTGSGRFNRTVCDIMDAEGPRGDVSGLFSFTWVSETEITFRRPPRPPSPRAAPLPMRFPLAQLETRFLYL